MGQGLRRGGGRGRGRRLVRRRCAVSPSLGLPITHTAIIPNNKDRIGESLGRFVEENFLTPENVMQRLAVVNVAKAGGTWLAEPANSERAAAGICAMVPRVLTMFQDEDVTRFLTRALLGELEKINLSRVAGEALELVTSGEQYQTLFDDAIKGIERLIAGNQALILEKFAEASKYTPELSTGTSWIVLSGGLFVCCRKSSPILSIPCACNSPIRRAS